MTSPVILGFFVPGKNNKKLWRTDKTTLVPCSTLHETYTNRSEILLNGTCSPSTIVFLLYGRIELIVFKHRPCCRRKNKYEIHVSGVPLMTVYNRFPPHTHTHRPCTTLRGRVPLNRAEPRCRLVVRLSHTNGRRRVENERREIKENDCDRRTTCNANSRNDYATVKNTLSIKNRSQVKIKNDLRDGSTKRLPTYAF